MAREEALSLTDIPLGFPAHLMRVPKGNLFGSVSGLLTMRELSRS
jgi:hypothetical protein